MNLDLLQILKEKGLLLDKEIFDALSSINDPLAIRKMLDDKKFQDELYEFYKKKYNEFYKIK